MKERTLDFIREMEFDLDKVSDLEKNMKISCIEYLNKNKKAIIENLLYLREYIPDNVLLEFLNTYPKTMGMSSEKFKIYIEKLKSVAPGKWSNILIMQFLGYEGYDQIFMKKGWDVTRYEPYLEIIGNEPDDEEVDFAVYSAVHPREREFKFIQMLKLLHIYIGTEFVAEDTLYTLEIHKNIVFNNIREQIFRGMSCDDICELLKENPMIFVNSPEWTRKELNLE